LSVANGVKEGLILFRQFKKVVVLTEVRRQADASQQQFIDVLNRIRECKVKHEDYDFLKSRIRDIASNTSEIMNGNYMYMVPTRKLAYDHNSEKLDQVVNSTQVRKCKLIARHNCSAAQNRTAESFCGLEAEVMIAVGARVMITNNIWTEQGLINGSFGIIKHILFDNNVRPPNLPSGLIIQMDHPYSGPHLPGLPRHIILPTIELTSNLSTTIYKREQFPISLAWSITTYKCQGIHIVNCYFKSKSFNF
jgi:hypothetical protein